MMVIRFPPPFGGQAAHPDLCSVRGEFSMRSAPTKSKKKKKKKIFKNKNKKVKGVRPDPGQRTHHSIHKTKKQRATSKTSL
jgi:hypothetical protein